MFRRLASASSIAFSQSDDSCETELFCLRKKCEEFFLGKNRVKTPSLNEELSVCVCEFSNMQISKSQKLLSAERSTLPSKVCT